MQRWDTYDERNKPERRPFDLDTFLISIGLDLAEKDVITLPITSHDRDGQSVHERRKYQLGPNGRLKACRE